MAGTGGEGNPPPVGDNRLLIDAITTQMERMMRDHIEGLYEIVEQLENQGNNDENEGRRRRRDNEGDARERIELRE